MIERRLRRLRLPALILVAASAGAAGPSAAATGSEAARAVVARMIEAHGGMETWAGAPTVSFEDEFRRGTADTGLPARVTVEQGRRRAYMDFPGTETRLAWDGEKAWSENWNLPMPPRFLALLNYHFLDLPWLALDPGVILGEPGTGHLWDDPTEYVTVRITYEPGTGDTPRDYYELYVDPATSRLKACEYVVTYKAVLPEGATASRPHVLVYDEYTTVDGLVVPTHYTIREKDGSVYASCTIGDWSFSRPFDESRVTMPEGAVVDESVP